MYLCQVSNEQKSKNNVRRFCILDVNDIEMATKQARIVLKTAPNENILCTAIDKGMASALDETFYRIFNLNSRGLI